MILYKFPPFRRYIDSLVNAQLTASDVKPEMELCFILSIHKYYRYVDEFKMPLDRWGQIQEHLTAMSAVLTGPEIDMLLDVFEANLSKLLEAVTGKAKLAPVSNLGFVVKEIRERKKVLFHPDIFAEIVATMYLREDEIGQPYNQKIHDQKLVAFAEAVKKKELDYFVLKGLDAYIPLLKSIPNELRQYSQEQEPKVRALYETLKRLTLQPESKMPVTPV